MSCMGLSPMHQQNRRSDLVESGATDEVGVVNQVYDGRSQRDDGCNAFGLNGADVTQRIDILLGCTQSQQVGFVLLANSAHVGWTPLAIAAHARREAPLVGTSG